MSRAFQDGQVMVERSDRTWSTGEGNGKPLQYSCLENPINSFYPHLDAFFCYSKYRPSIDPVPYSYHTVIDRILHIFLFLSPLLLIEANKASNSVRQISDFKHEVTC